MRKNNLIYIEEVKRSRESLKTHSWSSENGCYKHEDERKHDHNQDTMKVHVAFLFPLVYKKQNIKENEATGEWWQTQKTVPEEIVIAYC